jgi:hypothetical protein
VIFACDVIVTGKTVNAETIRRIGHRRFRAAGTCFRLVAFVVVGFLNTPTWAIFLIDRANI